jgi:hypothetical protein
MSWIPKPAFGRPAADTGSGLTFERRSLVDAFLDSYVSWREACEDVRSAYQRWGESLSAQRGLAYESYRAALDREERAAHVHSSSTERLRAAERG